VSTTGRSRHLADDGRHLTDPPARFAVRLRTNAWLEFTPFLAFDIEIRKIVCTTNAIELVPTSFLQVSGG
jgi:transposase-like protein